MSWRDEYQKGSFRGVPFCTQRHNRQGGRRGATKEMPGRDDPSTEDLGRKALSFSIECFVWGENYFAERDALIDALQAKGPGLLVHPWHGQMMVQAFDYESSEDTEEGGVCRFSITFGEAGLPVPSPVSAGAGSEAATAADEALVDAPQEFADKFSIEDSADWVEDAASDVVKGIATVSQIAAGMRGGVGPALRAFETGLGVLSGDQSSLMRAPLNLASAMLGLVSAVSVLGGSGGRSTKLAPLRLMLDYEPKIDDTPMTTPLRKLEASNRDALLTLFRVGCAAELVRAASELDYSSYNEAITTRDSINGRLDDLALAAADADDDTAAETFDALRRALTADIAAKGESLARVYSVTLAESEPALVVAHRLYRSDRRTSTSLEDRANDIAARNKVGHIGFLPGGVDLEVITSGDSQ